MTLDFARQEIERLRRACRVSPAIRFKLAVRSAARDTYGWRIRARTVTLYGSDEARVLSALYAFAERRLGVRWPQPGMEIIPAAPARLPAGEDQRITPDFEMRALGFHCSPPRTAGEWQALILWSSRRRLNILEVFIDSYEPFREAILPWLARTGIRMQVGGHSMHYFFISRGYQKAHPEWFAVDREGRRIPNQVCYRSAGFMRRYAANVCDYVRQRPEVAVVDLYPVDGAPHCQCRRCRRQDLSERILYAVNYVARAVRRVRPDLKVEHIAYFDNIQPPARLRAEPNVMVGYCEYWDRSWFHPAWEMHRGNGPLQPACLAEYNRRTPREALAAMTAWIDTGARVGNWSYYADNVIKRGYAVPIVDVVKADLPFYKFLGVHDAKCLVTNTSCLWLDMPHLYVWSRLLEVASDETADQSACEYYDAMYGPLGPDVQKLHQDVFRWFTTRTRMGFDLEEMMIHDIPAVYSLTGFNRRLDRPAFEAQQDALARLQGRLRDLVRRARGEQARADLQRWQRGFQILQHCHWVEWSALRYYAAWQERRRRPRTELVHARTAAHRASRAFARFMRPMAAAHGAEMSSALLNWRQLGAYSLIGKLDLAARGKPVKLAWWE